MTQADIDEFWTQNLESLKPHGTCQLARCPKCALTVVYLCYAWLPCTPTILNCFHMCRTLILNRCQRQFYSVCEPSSDPEEFEILHAKHRKRCQGAILQWDA